MRHFELKTNHNISVTTPNGKVVIGVDTPYNSDPETYVYFADVLGRATKSVNLMDLLKAYEDEVGRSSGEISNEV